MVLGDPKTCFYQFILHKNDSDDTEIVQYFIMLRLVICVKLDIFVRYMFYEWTFSHNTEVPISIKQNK